MAQEESKRTEATVNVELLAKEYISWEPYEPFRKEVEEALSNKDNKKLQDMFFKRIAFGTAGLRSRMAGGYSYMNDLVIIQTSQGLCKYLDAQIPDAKKRGVVIGYDGRHHSKRFSEIAASVFKEYGFRIYLFHRFACTPLVPFAILPLKCVCGIVVTASHNPKDDNGYKVYWENGAQIIPPHDEGIAACIESNLKPWKKYTPFVLEQDPNQKEIDITKKIGDAYFHEIAARYSYHNKENKNSQLKVTYTAMHGVGTHWMTQAYEAFNLPSFIPVKEQIDPDPNFTTVKFPNPEEKGALDIAIKTADAHNSTLVIANDPDADRLAIAEKIKNSKEWKVFNGNEIAILLSDWAFINYMKNNPKADVSKLVMIASTVSSKYLQSYATRNGFHFVDTLTGFKWMGNKAVELINQGYVFLFAFEVEIGFLVGDLSFDKDGVRCGVIFHEMAAQLHRNGKTCLERLEELRAMYGYFEMEPSYKFADEKKMSQVFTKLRNWSGKNTYPAQMGKYKITRVRDVTTGYDTKEKDNKCALPLQPTSQMITFWFENGATVTLRNSGTEPKLKYYVEAKHDQHAKEARTIVDDMVKILLKEFMQME